MIKSMTGYGRAVQTVNGREFTVEVRSVNNRYLDCNVKLPRMVSFAEDAVKQAGFLLLILDNQLHKADAHGLEPLKLKANLFLNLGVTRLADRQVSDHGA